ncbi:hypothetical protein C7U60_06770 [Mesorhizobium plurifarium]|uniref:hypothetical protein n=1 Tax=Sinorhizobium arboris TaxID=76745 RepID=UPI000410D068|nr:hypothetical protein [Sinorhizobium arboris]PST25572.1 hypothetical protein C7U60_06770 [Mesorhizobium plurifarium]
MPMVPRWVRESHAEFIFVFRYAFRHNLRTMDRVAWFLLLPVSVMFVPYHWLALAANKTVFFALSDRHTADYAYLLHNRPEFAEAYVGGVVVQLVILVVGLIVHSYFAATSRDIVFVADKKRLYLCWVFFTVVFCAFGVFSFSRMTDFGLSAEVSWFADNPDAVRKLMPLTPNSSAFLMTSLFLGAGAFVPMVVVQMLMIVALGRRVKFHEIKGEYVDGR